MNNLMYFLEEKLTPIGGKISQQRHLKAISKGVMVLIPLTFVGAIFQIIATPPLAAEFAANTGFFKVFFEGWITFSQNWGSVLRVPYNMTVNMMGLIVSFSVSFYLAKHYKLPEILGGTLSMLIFLMVAAPITEGYLLSNVIASSNDLEKAGIENIMSSGSLGASGLFSAMIIAVISVEITRFLIERDIRLKLPEAVPPAIANSFNTIIPLLVNIVIIYGFNVFLLKITNLNLIDGIMYLLTPSINAVNTVWGMAFLIFLSMFLWTLGIHGTSIIYPFLLPISMQCVALNAELVASGEAAIFYPVTAFSYALIGGSGATLGLNLLMLRSKSSQLKIIGKISIVPGILDINEPLIFGAPLILNPLMMIPFILTPLVNYFITIIAAKIGLISGQYVFFSGSLPHGLPQAITTMNWVNGVFAISLLFVSIIIYYPFFKIYESSLVTEERSNNNEE